MTFSVNSINVYHFIKNQESESMDCYKGCHTGEIPPRSVKVKKRDWWRNTINFFAVKLFWFYVIGHFFLVIKQTLHTSHFERKIRRIPKTTIFVVVLCISCSHSSVCHSSLKALSDAHTHTNHVFLMEFHFRSDNLSGFTLNVVF